MYDFFSNKLKPVRMLVKFSESTFLVLKGVLLNVSWLNHTLRVFEFVVIIGIFTSVPFCPTQESIENRTVGNRICYIVLWLSILLFKIINETRQVNNKLVARKKLY